MSRICLGLLITLVLASTGCGGYGSNNMGGNGGAPSIMNLSPNMKTSNDPAFVLTVNGSGFGTDWSCTGTEPLFLLLMEMEHQ